MTKSIHQVYTELFNKRPDGRWSESRIQEEIDARKSQLETEERNRRENEERLLAKKAQRQQRIIDRGTPQEFSKYSNMDNLDAAGQQTAMVIRRCVEWAETEAAMKYKFTQDIVKENCDLAYSLSWSADLFKAAARASVARLLLNAFNEGAVDEYFKSNILNAISSKCAWVGNSTSQTSNIITAETNAAYASLLEIYI